MKKQLLILLLFTGFLQAQTYPTNPTKFGKISLNTNGISTSTSKINTQESDGQINYIDAVNLPVPTTVTNALDLKTTVSAGAVSGFALTNNGNGTVNIASGIAYLRLTNDPYSSIVKYPISAVTNLSLTDNANNYVLVDYNAGSPTITVTTNGSIINTQTNSLAYVISRVGNTLDYLNLVGQNVDPNAKLRVRFLNQEGIRRASGATIGFSNRNLTLTSSVLFSGLIRLNAPAFNTQTPDTFTLAYNNGATWTRTTAQTQVNNTQYNVSGVLTTMPNNDYRTDYVYLLPNNPSKLYVIMGTATYNSLTLAKGAPRPSSLPVELQVLGVEVGRLFIQKNSTTIAEVQSSFANDFIGASVPEHNSLSGLQGGLADQRNHLDNAQVSLVNGSEQSINKATDFTTVNNTLYPSVQAVKGQLDIKADKIESTIGDIYNRTSWSNLNDFTNTGSFTYSDSKINVPVNSNGQLLLNYVTSIDKYNLQFDYRSTNGVKSNTGLAIGFISQNTANPVSHYAYFVESGVNAGKIALYASFGASTSYSSSTLPAYDAGDKLRMSIDNLGGVNYVVTLTNLTKGTSINYPLNVGTSGLNQAFIHNTAKPAIISLNVLSSYEISKIVYSSNFKKGGILGLGDSIVQGYNASISTGRWTDLIGAQNAGGSGDRSADLILRLDEVINTVRPKTVYLAIGTNDGDINVWKSNYSIIVSKLESNGIEVIKMTPTPNNIADLTAYKNYILSTYPNSSIDVFTPLAVGTGLNPIYNGDGVHPNSAGHAAIANTITSSPLYALKTYYSKLDSNVVLGRSNGALTASVYAGNVPKLSVVGTLENSAIYDVNGNISIGTKETNGNKFRVDGGSSELNQMKYTRALEYVGPLNSLIDAGFYAIGAGTEGAPDGRDFYVTVERHFANADFVHQTATSYGFLSVPNQIYSRVSVGASWTPWRELSYTDSPTFTGVPEAPTAPPGTYTDQISTTKFVLDNSMALSGNQTFTGRKTFNSDNTISGGITVNNLKTTTTTFGDNAGIYINNTGTTGILLETYSGRGIFGKSIGSGNAVTLEVFDTGHALSLTSQGGTGDLLNAGNGITRIDISSRLSTALAPVSANDVTNKAYVDALKPYKVYSATLNQVSTGAPTTTIFENSVGAIVWTRITTGMYWGTLTGAFPVDKTHLSITPSSPTGSYSIYRNTDDIIVVQTKDTSLFPFVDSDDKLFNNSIEIKVYN